MDGLQKVLDFGSDSGNRNNAKVSYLFGKDKYLSLINSAKLSINIQMLLIQRLQYTHQTLGHFIFG